MGVGQAIANGYMGKCEMVWTTAGTNRVCSRCMELRGRVVGTTEDSGVTIPPLHPRCRCTIMYQEVEPAKALRTNKPKPSIMDIAPLVAIPAITAETISPPKKPAADEATIRAKLEKVRAELGIKGEIIYPPPQKDFSNFVFDAVHTQGDKHPHDVNEEEARRFISEAYFALNLPKIDSLNFFGGEGATYVRPKQKKIRTSFKREEYNLKIRTLVEAYENEFS